MGLSEKEGGGGGALKGRCRPTSLTLVVFVTVKVQQNALLRGVAKREGVFLINLILEV